MSAQLVNDRYTDVDHLRHGDFIVRGGRLVWVDRVERTPTGGVAGLGSHPRRVVAVALPEVNEVEWVEPAGTMHETWYVCPCRSERHDHRTPDEVLAS